MTYTSRTLGSDEAALRSYAELFAKTVGPQSVDYLTWLYLENPHGMAVGTNAWLGETLAAHYTTIPVVAMFEGKRSMGLLSLNTATHPDHQGKGLFTRLAEETYARGAKLGYEFVVGVANANSTHGFTKKLGFQLVTPLDVRIGIGPLSISKREAVFAHVWDRPSLNWRLARPGASYLIEKTKADEVAVFAKARRGILAYVTHAPRSVVEQMPTTSLMDPLRMWIGIDAGTAPGAAFAPVPDQLKPSPLNLIFRDLTGRNRRLDKDATRFTLRDFDAY